MNPKLKKYWSQNEGISLDFKECITSANKIAKTLVAFANQKGGHVVVGVSDNKQLPGIIPEEEKFMIELAAKQYCKPPLEPQYEVIESGNKSFLLVFIAESTEKPCLAKNEKGAWKAYIRIEDSSTLSGPVWYLGQVYKKTGPELIHLDATDQKIMSFIANHPMQNLEQCIKTLKINRRKLVKRLAQLLHLKLIQIQYNPHREECFVIASPT